MAESHPPDFYQLVFMDIEMPHKNGYLFVVIVVIVVVIVVIVIIVIVVVIIVHFLISNLPFLLKKNK